MFLLGVDTSTSNPVVMHTQWNRRTCGCDGNSGAVAVLLGVAECLSDLWDSWNKGLHLHATTDDT